MKRQSKQTTPATTPATNDALAHFRRSLARGESLHRPITPERAAEIADALMPFDDDAMIYLFLELLHGMMYAAYKKDAGPSIDDLVLFATIAAYKKTHHFEASLDEFALLDWHNERDKKVIFGEIKDEGEAASNSVS